MDLRVAIAADQQDGVGSVFLIPHFTLAEMTAMCPVIDPIFDGTLVLFRPLNQRGINAWVKRVRERWGCSFVSRKEDLLHLHEKLKQGGKAAILFDQNAGRAGLLFPFFGRLISATHLPGLLAERHGAASFVAYPKRTGFWRATIAWKRLEPDLTAEQIAFAAHDHLADYLSQSIDQCADWLWLHNRWKNALTHFKSRFRLDSRKLRLKEYLAFHGQAEPSKRTRYWFRLPSSREQINSVERYLHAVAKARPDVEITLLGHPEEIEVTSAWAWLPKRLVIPQSAIARCSFIRKMRREYADLYICLSDQTKDIRLGWLLGIPQRFGWPTGSWSDQFSTQTAPSSVKSSDEWDSFFSVFGLSHQAYP